MLSRSIEFDHNEIHLMSGLLNSLAIGHIESPQEIKDTWISQLQLKISIAHDSIIDEMDSEI